jgi:membrane-bound lytic murein transglycosylase D
MKRKIVITIFFIVILSSGYAIYNSLTDRIVYMPEYQNRHQLFLYKMPHDLNFAGEEVELNNPDAYEKLEREMRINAANNSSSRLLLMNVRIWLPRIAEILKKNNIPEDFKYVAVAESNLTNSVSHKGAAGFWQFTEATAIELGLEVNDEVDERYHPEKSTKAACLYFKRAHKKFGSWTAAAASYNRGINGLERAFKNQNVNSYYDLALNDETSRYIFRIMAVKDLIKNPKKYGFKTRIARAQKIKKIKITKHISNLDEFAKSYHITLETLKEYNPWLLENTLTIEDGKTYELLIPK